MPDSGELKWEGESEEKRRIRPPHMFDMEDDRGDRAGSERI